MDVLQGRSALAAGHGPLFAVVGVFDGLHLGHAYLLGRLVAEARARQARPAVVTFDAHPDAILTGQAPPLLIDPAERLERLAAAGVEIVIVEHFDDQLRRTPYDVFVRGISGKTRLSGLLMTPDAAFGHERAGTPATLAELGRADGFEVVVVDPFEIDGREVRSSTIRAAIGAGDLAAAAALLGRPYAVIGRRDGLGKRIVFDTPVALPPRGPYRIVVASPTGAQGRPAEGRVGPAGFIELVAPDMPAGERLRIVFAGG